MGLRKLTSLKENFINRFGKKEKKYTLFLTLSALTMLNTGFTAQPTAELKTTDTTTEIVEEANLIPSEDMKELIVEESQKLPSGITVSDSGKVILAENDEHKVLFSEKKNSTLTEAEEETLREESYDINSVSGVDDSQYASVMAMEATAYLPTDGSGAGVTAMGIPATYGVAAVDPSVIPLGTRLYVPGYGEAIAADTGGAIYGYKIDLCMESYEEAMNFGRRTITVYVLK